MAYDFWLTARRGSAGDRHVVTPDSAPGAFTTSLCGRLVTTERGSVQVEDLTNGTVDPVCPTCVAEVVSRAVLS